MKILFLINKFKILMVIWFTLALTFKVWMGNCVLEAVDLSFGRGFLLRWGGFKFWMETIAEHNQKLKNKCDINTLRFLFEA